MRQIDQEVLIQQLLPIARLAGNAIMAVYYRGTKEVKFKEDDIPLTEAVVASHPVLS